MWAALAVLVADHDGVDVIVVTFRKCDISGSATSTNAHPLSFFQAKSGPHLAAGLWVQAPSQPACPISARPDFDLARRVGQQVQFRPQRSVPHWKITLEQHPALKEGGPKERVTSMHLIGHH
jgi:hypothetical protein